MWLPHISMSAIRNEIGYITLFVFYAELHLQQYSISKLSQYFSAGAYLPTAPDKEDKHR